MSHALLSRALFAARFGAIPLQMSRTRRQLKITAIPNIKRITQVTCYERPSAKVLYYKESSTSTYVPVQTPTMEILSSGIAEMEQTKSTLVVCVNEGIIYFKMLYRVSQNWLPREKREP
jgi:hypothetical protein